MPAAPQQPDFFHVLSREMKYVANYERTAAAAAGATHGDGLHDTAYARLDEILDQVPPMAHVRGPAVDM